MNKFLVLLISLLIFGCSDNKSPMPSWGNLPGMDSAHWKKKEKCTGRVFASVPFNAIDVGKSLHPFGKPATGVSHQMLIGDTCLIASISTTVYELPEDQKNNHYSISVEVPQKDIRCIDSNSEPFCDESLISYAVVFNRDLAQNEVDDFFKGKNMRDVIVYDNDKKIVKFTVNTQIYSYVLPNL